MSLIQRFTVLSESAQNHGLDRLTVEKAFAGSSLEAVGNDSSIADAVCWNEGQQSAMLCLDTQWNVAGFLWNDEEECPNAEWIPSAELAHFFSSCISYAKENHLSLQDLGCADGDAEDEDEDSIWEAPVSLMGEVRQVLENSNRVVEDVAYVKVPMKRGGFACIPFEHFAEIASDVEYERIGTVPAIHSDLCIVMKDGSFFGRMWADGSEWFHFYEAPEQNPEMACPSRDELCILYSDALD